MMFFSIMHELKGVKEVDELRRILRTKVIENRHLSSEEQDVINAYIDSVCSDFSHSHENDFWTYYKSLEDEFIDYDAPRFLSIIGSKEVFPDNLLDLFSISPEFVIGDIENLMFKPMDFDVDNIPHPFMPLIKDHDVLEIFGAVHGLLSYLSPGNPFSYSSRNSEQSKTARHPLYLETFKEYIDALLKDILCVDVTEGLDYTSSSRIQVRRM